MIMSLVLFENEFLNIVAISFTALILNELIMVALEITTWLVTFPCAFVQLALHMSLQAYLHGYLGDCNAVRVHDQYDIPSGIFW